MTFFPRRWNGIHHLANQTGITEHLWPFEETKKAIRGDGVVVEMSMPRYRRDVRDIEEASGDQ